MTDKVIKESSREQIATLSAKSRGGVFNIRDAEGVFNLDPKKAAQRLAALARQGWITRVKRGVYMIVPIEAANRKNVVDDPWILAKEIFSPCYVGGWSAAEHLHLTEQLFRSVLVITSVSSRKTEIDLAGYNFKLFSVAKKRIESANLINVWRGTERINVSSKEQTLADCLRNPSLCGGMRTLIDILQNYKSETENWDSLMKVMLSSANGAAWQRLGYLIESFDDDKSDALSIIEEHKGKGRISLDPSVKDLGLLNKRWNLLVNVISEKGESSFS